MIGNHHGSWSLMITNHQGSWSFMLTTHHGSWSFMTTTHQGSIEGSSRHLVFGTKQSRNEIPSRTAVVSRRDLSRRAEFIWICHLVANMICSMGHGPWAVVHEPWSMRHGPWTMVHGPWSMNHGPWTMVHVRTKDTKDTKESSRNP